MTDITELAQLRAELSSPAIGSSAHLRKIALSLVEALEKAQRHANLTEAERQAYLGLISKRDERIAELESRLNSADKLQDSAFRSGLQHGFSLGQTDDQKGYEQSMAAYSPAAGIREAE